MKKDQPQLLQSGAIFNKERTHRYVLWRMWNISKPAIMYIGLNPSKADETKNDATITRCRNFAEAEGYGRLFFLNLYSFRTPYVREPIPDHLRIFEGIEWQPLIDNLATAVGPDYNGIFLDYMGNADKVVCCWGAFPFISERQKEVLAMIKDPWCFGSNANGSPKHPLYLASATKLIRYISEK